MDMKTTTIKNKTRKYSKKDIKMCGSTKSSPLATPPPPKACGTPLRYHKTKSHDDYEEMFNSEDASPVLLSTQEGGRGCEVTWDWRSPNRKDDISHNTPQGKIKIHSNHKMKSISPLLHVPCKRKLQKPSNKNFFNNLHAQLAEIQQKFYSNKSNVSPESIMKKKSTTKEFHREVAVNAKDKLTKNDETSGITELFQDDSFTDLLVQCSQAVESEINMEEKLLPDFNRNDIGKNSERSKRNLRNKSPELFCDYDEPMFQRLSHKTTPKLTTNEYITSRKKHYQYTSVRSPRKGLQTPKKKCDEIIQCTINDDSFDAILSTLSEDVFTDSDNICQISSLAKNCDTKTSSIRNGRDIKQLQSIEEDKEKCFLKAGHMTKTTESDYSTPALETVNKTRLIRHNSMPVSPRILGNNNQQGSIGRHSSMPYNDYKNNQRQRYLSSRTDSSDSLTSQSSTMLCTPDEIERKRQEAIRKKEARRIRQEIERRRLEAIEKLQMKSKVDTRKNPR